MTTTKERRKKEETKDEEYIITYTRHLEKRLRNLEAVNLKLKQELNNLRNEKDKYKNGTYKILLFGGPGVDMSRLSPRFSTNLRKSDSQLTTGVEYKVKNIVVDNKKYKLQIWDWTGEEKFSFLPQMYSSGARGALLIYDITEKTSVAKLQNWIKKTKDLIKYEGANILPIPTVVLGDNPNLRDKDHVNPQYSTQFGKFIGVDQFIEVNIRTGENVEEAFEALTRLILAYENMKTENWDEHFSKYLNDLKKRKRWNFKSNREKLMKTAQLRIEKLEASRSGRSLCYVDQSIMESLGIATGDIIEIVGKKRTAGIVVASLSDKGKDIIRIDGIQRLNLGSTIGEFVTIQPTLASPAREIELAPTKAIYNIKKQADVIKGKLIDKPIMAGDIIDLPGAFIKTDEDYAPMNGFMKMLNMGGGSKRPTLGPLRLIVLNTKPTDEVVRFTRETRVKINKKIAFLNSSGSLITSDDIVGLEKEIFEIKKLLELSYNHPSVTEKLNIEPLKGILLVGPTGTGKTLLAKVIANETNYNFISIQPTDIFHKYQGDSEKKLKELFEMAERKAPSLIFIDHIDSIAPIIKRELIDNSRNLEHRIVTQLMGLMDGIYPYRNVIVLGATHKLDLIEPALLRPGRFDKIIHFSLPDLISRTKIYQLYTRDLLLDDEISLEEIAKLSENFTGADIKGVCRLAVMNAVKRDIPELQKDLDNLPDESVINTKVTKQDFLSAIEEIADRLK